MKIKSYEAMPQYLSQRPQIAIHVWSMSSEFLIDKDGGPWLPNGKLWAIIPAHVFTGRSKNNCNHSLTLSIRKVP